MRTLILVVLGVVLILAGLFLYLPPVFGIPCLGWYKDLFVLVKATGGAVIILFGLIVLAIAK